MRNKTIIACLAFSTLFLAGTVQANDGFNKFPSGSVALERGNVQVSTYRVIVQPTSVKKNGYVKRVVIPAVAEPAQNPSAKSKENVRFNKVDRRAETAISAMPVYFDVNSNNAR
ncbi:hypothetical protein [uncultured Algimonas sp.]|uniref:hypothetical protein n=1 Tax=uncultured Algimonas sp. TaxID=1547920 RepID=UPI0026298032|nr:hypothetical protein [uncultured Algimonas sp.]